MFVPQLFVKVPHIQVEICLPIKPQNLLCRFHRHPLQAAKVEISICNVMELRDGKIYREREYMDRLTMLEQLGLAPSSPKAE